MRPRNYTAIWAACLPASQNVHQFWASFHHFYVEMPGLKVGSIDVQVEDDQLIVAAERTRLEWPQETQVHIAEREYGPIKRAFRLPLNARRDGIRAAYTDGVLELTVEKRTESKPIKVQVN